MFHPQGPSFFELARQALSSTQRGYDLLAPKFDFTPFRTPDAALDAVTNYLKRSDPVEASLDVCCGTGAGMEMLSKVTTKRVCGIDFSQGMLEQASINLKDSTAPSDGWQLDLGDAFEMNYDNEFDLAVCFGALGHILPRDEDRFIERIAAALRPGGRFVFLTSVKPPVVSMTRLMSRGFNAAMHVRNVVRRPPFIMFYLTFLWPEIDEKLKRHGFSSTVHEPFSGRWKFARLVDATKH